VAGIAASPPAPFFNNTTAANTTLANAIVLPAPSADTTYTIQKTSAGGQINFTGVISGGSANVKLFLNASTGGDATTTYRFAGANTFTAPQIEIWRGGVVIGHMSGLGNPTNELIMDGNNNTALGDLRFEVGGTFPNPIHLLAGGGGGINTNANNVTFSGVMSGGNNLLKLGTGIMTMTATNTYSGTTTVAAGVLRINGDNSAATGAITVNAGASLGGTGTIGAPVAVTAGGTLAPGASIGTTTVANSVTVTGNAAPNQTLWDVELNGIAPNTLATADQTNVDRLVVTGAANNLNFVTSSTNRVRINLTQLGGTFTINGSPVFYRIATANAGSNLQSNGGTFDPTHFDFTTSGFTANSFSLAVDQNHLVISFVPVPEPGLLLGAGLLVLGTARVLRRNRRFRSAEQG
jgi:fibronectin-binding autotransporter adhesin